MPRDGFSSSASKAAQKLPPNLEDLKDHYNKLVARAVVKYNIPRELVIFF
jgi:hypothetical protein